MYPLCNHQSQRSENLQHYLHADATSFDILSNAVAFIDLQVSFKHPNTYFGYPTR